MTESLTGTVALITGASSGIGDASARRLAAEGATVALVARREDRLNALAAEIRASGGTAMTIATDLSTPAEAEAAVKRVVDEFGRLDTVVNAAGVMLIGDSIDSPLEHWDRMVDINLKGLMYVTKAALPHLVAAVGSGTREVADLVNISSVAGRSVSSYTALYNATKFAVTAASESWRQEFAARGVRVSVIEPGAVATELMRHQQGTQAWYDQMNEAGDILLPADVADVTAYIVTNPKRVAINEVVIRPTHQA